MQHLRRLIAAVSKVSKTAATAASLAPGSRASQTAAATSSLPDEWALTPLTLTARLPARSCSPTRRFAPLMRPWLAANSCSEPWRCWYSV